MAPTSFCHERDLLAVGLECTGTPGTALRIAMITYMPNGGMYAPPARRREEGRAKGKRRTGQNSNGKGQKANGKDGIIEFCHLPFAICLLTCPSASAVWSRAGRRRVAQTCIFSACLRSSEGTAPRFPSVIRAVLEAGRPDSPFGSMIADLINRCLRHPAPLKKLLTSYA